MKTLLLLAALAALGYYAYQTWFAVPPAPTVAGSPSAAASADAPRAPVDFAVKARVRKLFEEWKRRQLLSSQPHGARLTDMARELDDVRRHLFGKAIHGEKALEELIANALRELGVAQEECARLANEIIAEARSDVASEAAGGDGVQSGSLRGIGNGN